VSNELVEILTAENACDRAQAIAVGFDGKTPEEAWNTWRFSPDLLWIAATLGIKRELITLACCDCAWLTIPLLTDDPQFAEVVAVLQRSVLGGTTHQEIVDAVSALRAPTMQEAIDFRTSRLAAAKRMVECIAATTWFKLPELADVAADAAAQTYRVGHSVSADLVRSRIPWGEVALQLRRRQR
jgi:hypothetical protein